MHSHGDSDFICRKAINILFEIKKGNRKCLFSLALLSDKCVSELQLQSLQMKDM
jgi:hypothetical protein